MRVGVVVGSAVVSLLALGCATSAPGATPIAPGEAPAAADSEAHGEHGPDRAARPAAADGSWIGGGASSEYVLTGMRDEFVGVWVDVPQPSALEHVPTALTLTIDTSGSMKGDKIRHARASARKIIDSLEDGDILSIVTFDDSSRVRLAPTELTHHSRRRALAVVDELVAHGGTAMFNGLAQADAQFWDVPATHLVRRIVMISDGKATVGRTAASALGDLAQQGVDKGVQVTAVGVGLDYDEDTLNTIAIRSSGRLYHLTESHELPAIVERELGLLQGTAAVQAIVEVVPAPGVTIEGVERAEFARNRNRVHIPLGSMHGGQQRELLLRVSVESTGEGHKPLASVRLHYRDPAQGGVQRVQESIVSATVTDSSGLVAEHPVERTQAMVAMRRASDLAHQASLQVGEGNLEVAAASLEDAQTHLRQRARRSKDTVEKRRLNREADNMAKLRKGVKKASATKGPARKKKARDAELILNDAAMAADGY